MQGQRAALRHISELATGYQSSKLQSSDLNLESLTPTSVFLKIMPTILSAKTEAVYTAFCHSVSTTKTAATELITYRVSGTMSKILHCLSYLRDDSESLCSCFETMHPFLFPFTKIHPRTCSHSVIPYLYKQEGLWSLTHQSMTRGTLRICPNFSQFYGL